MLSRKEFFRKFMLEDGEAPIANTTANVAALETQPVITRQIQARLIRRNKKNAPKIIVRK